MPRIIHHYGEPGLLRDTWQGEALRAGDVWVDTSTVPPWRRLYLVRNRVWPKGAWVRRAGVNYADPRWWLKPGLYGDTGDERQEIGG